MPKKKQDASSPVNPPTPLSPEKQKLVNMIHKWAYTEDSKKRTELFKKIWETRFGKDK